MECIALHDQHTGEYILNGTKTWFLQYLCFVFFPSSDSSHSFMLRAVISFLRITNSPVADLFIVWGKLVGWVGASAKPQGKSSKSGSPASSICGFLVERSARGLRTPVIEGKLSLRTSIAGHVVLEDVRVPAANILPGANRLSVRVIFVLYS